MIQRVTIDFYGIRKFPCWETEVYGHLPHFWYDPDRLRRYFCRGH